MQMMNDFKKFLKSFSGFLTGILIGLTISFIILICIPINPFGTQGMTYFSIILTIALSCLGGWKGLQFCTEEDASS